MKRKAKSERKQRESKGTENNADFPGYPHYPANEDIMDQRTDMHRVDLDVENLSNARNRPGSGHRLAKDNILEDRGHRTNLQNGTDDDFSDINPRTEMSRRDIVQNMDTTVSEIGIPQTVENSALDVEISGTDREEVSTDADVTPEERMTLENMYMPTKDEENLRRSKLDNTDLDGDELNEGSFGAVLSSTELDMPEESDGALDTDIGQGDEENAYYSLGGDRQEGNREDPYSGPNRGNDA